MINLHQNVVYLAAPKRLYQSHLFQQAYEYLLPKCISVVDPRGMYKSNQDWLANYETRLEICDTMIIVSDDMLVGKGVYTEYNYFWRRNCKVYHIIEFGKSFHLIPVKRLKIVDDDDWTNYAKIQYT
jgi:hypothetical protein